MHGGEAVPGPQDYNPAPPAKGPAFTISGKPAPAADGNAVPGPGEYCAAAAAERGPAFTLGAKLPAGVAPAEAPGPADYPIQVHSHCCWHLCPVYSTLHRMRILGTATISIPGKSLKNTCSGLEGWSSH